MTAIHSPCVGICSTTYGADVCYGCARTRNEIDNWYTFEEQNRALSLKRIRKFVERSMVGTITVVDQTQFEQYSSSYLKYKDESLHMQIYQFLVRTRTLNYTWEEIGLSPVDNIAVADYVATILKRIRNLSVQHRNKREKLLQD